MSGGLSVGRQDFLRELASSPSPLSYFIKKGKAYFIKKGKASLIKEGKASLIKEGERGLLKQAPRDAPTSDMPMRRRWEDSHILLTRSSCLHLTETGKTPLPRHTKTGEATTSGNHLAE